MNTDSHTILYARGITKSFKGFIAVNAVDLKITRGSIHALIGPNGAGKTTCFNLLTQFLKPTSGKIFFNGEDITDNSPTTIARKGIVRSFQISAIFPSLSVLENVRIALQRRSGLSYHFWRSDKVLQPLDHKAMELLEKVGLESFANHLSLDLSYGHKRALEFATTLAVDPELLLLDEPTQGMSRDDVSLVTKLINDAREGRTVVIVEHNMKVVAEIADRI